MCIKHFASRGIAALYMCLYHAHPSDAIAACKVIEQESTHHHDLQLVLIVDSGTLPKPVPDKHI